MLCCRSNCRINVGVTPDVDCCNNTFTCDLFSLFTCKHGNSTVDIWEMQLRLTGTEDVFAARLVLGAVCWRWFTAVAARAPLSSAAGVRGQTAQARTVPVLQRLGRTCNPWKRDTPAQSRNPEVSVWFHSMGYIYNASPYRSCSTHTIQTGLYLWRILSCSCPAGEKSTVHRTDRSKCQTQTYSATDWSKSSRAQVDFISH